MDGALRRTLSVLALYGLATLLILPLLDGIRGLLLLPPLFLTLARVLLALGAVVAGIVAWRYEPGDARAAEGEPPGPDAR